MKKINKNLIGLLTFAAIGTTIGYSIANATSAKIKTNYSDDLAVLKSEAYDEGTTATGAVTKILTHGPRNNYVILDGGYNGKLSPSGNDFRGNEIRNSVLFDMRSTTVTQLEAIFKISSNIAKYMIENKLYLDKPVLDLKIMLTNDRIMPLRVAYDTSTSVVTPSGLTQDQIASGIVSSMLSTTMVNFEITDSNDTHFAKTYNKIKELEGREEIPAPSGFTFGEKNFGFRGNINLLGFEVKTPAPAGYEYRFYVIRKEASNGSNVSVGSFAGAVFTKNMPKSILPGDTIGARMVLVDNSKYLSYGSLQTMWDTTGVVAIEVGGIFLTPEEVADGLTEEQKLVNLQSDFLSKLGTNIYGTGDAVSTDIHSGILGMVDSSILPSAAVSDLDDFRERLISNISSLSLELDSELTKDEQINVFNYILPKFKSINIRPNNTRGTILLEILGTNKDNPLVQIIIPGFKKTGDA